MSLDPQSHSAVPDMTMLVAEAAFPKGNPYLTLQKELDVIFSDENFLLNSSRAALIYTLDSKPESS